MGALRRQTARLAVLLALGGGLVLGTGIGLPTAHWVAGVLTRSGVTGATTAPAPQSSPSTTPLPAVSATPTSSATPSASATPSPSPPLCPVLAAGQQPLDPLVPPPSGYSADASLDWIGCGDQVVPVGLGFTVSGGWLVAVSYTCPTGTAAMSAGPTLVVEATVSGSGRASETAAENQGDQADVIDDAVGAPALGAGTYRLAVTTPSACLWHLAVYRGT